MRECKLDVADVVFCDEIKRFAVQDQAGFSHLVVGDFDVVKGDAEPPADADGFHKGFFGGEAGCIILMLITFGFAIGDFAGAEDLLREGRSFADEIPDALYFDDVCSYTVDQGFGL